MAALRASGKLPLGAGGAPLALTAVAGPQLSGAEFAPAAGVVAAVRQYNEQHRQKSLLEQHMERQAAKQSKEKGEKGDKGEKGGRKEREKDKDKEKKGKGKSKEREEGKGKKRPAAGGLLRCVCGGGGLGGPGVEVGREFGGQRRWLVCCNKENDCLLIHLSHHTYNPRHTSNIPITNRAAGRGLGGQAPLEAGELSVGGCVSPVARGVALPCILCTSRLVLRAW